MASPIRPFKYLFRGNHRSTNLKGVHLPSGGCVIGAAAGKMPIIKNNRKSSEGQTEEAKLRQVRAARLIVLGNMSDVRFKAGVDSLSLVSLSKNSLITFQHILLHLVWKNTRLLHLSLALDSDFRKWRLWWALFSQPVVILESACSYWLHAVILMLRSDYTNVIMLQNLKFSL